MTATQDVQWWPIPLGVLIIVAFTAAVYCAQWWRHR